MGPPVEINTKEINWLKFKRNEARYKLCHQSRYIAIHLRFSTAPVGKRVLRLGALLRSRQVGRVVARGGQMSQKMRGKPVADKPPEYGAAEESIAASIF